MKKITINEKRDYGIDLLRIVAMFMIVLLHVVNVGGGRANSVSGTVSYAAAYGLYIFTFPCVNIYGLISGYVGFSATKTRLTNGITLWARVIFYSLIMGAINIIIFGFSTDTAFAMFFPVTNNSYWYFTIYFCLFLLMPLINNGINGLTKRQFSIVIVGLFALTLTTTSVFNRDSFVFKYGCSLPWLLFLYLVGAYIKKYDFLAKIKKWQAVLGFVASSVFVLAYKLILDRVDPFLEGKGGVLGLLGKILSPDTFFRHDCIPVFAAGVFYLLFFRNLKLSDNIKKIISVIAPMAFSVYIIHQNGLVWNNLIVDKFIPLATEKPLILVLGCIGFSVLIFVACLLIDSVRVFLFSIMKIDKYAKKLNDKICKNDS
ncbi:MAG TPA: acyltransferase family protein [Clostridiales bacterium]|nr:acyltransferase family protein [Clostridiales bacterium]